MMQQPYRGISLGFLKTFLEGSVDRVIYRDYIVNRRFFIYCSLASTPRGKEKTAPAIRAHLVREKHFVLSPQQPLTAD